MTPRPMGLATAASEAAQAAHGHAGGEEGEDRHGHPGRERPDAVLEGLGEPVGRVVLGHGAHRHAERQQDAGNGGMNAGGVGQRPGDDGERHQQQPRRPPVPGEQPLAPVRDHGEGGDRHERCQEQARLQVPGVEEGDDRDRDQVVGDGEGEQEGPQGRGQVRPDHREHGEGERDVGCRRDGPARPCLGVGERAGEEDQRRHGHAADRCDHRHEGRLRVAQVAGDELALELEPDEEEEHGQQPVSGPVAERQVQVQAEDIAAQMGVTQAEVELREGVGCDHRGRGGNQ